MRPKLWSTYPHILQSTRPENCLIQVWQKYQSPDRIVQGIPLSNITAIQIEESPPRHRHWLYSHPKGRQLPFD